MPRKARRIAILAVCSCVLTIAAWQILDWLPPPLPAATTVAATTPKARQYVRTPFIDDWDQAPLEDMNAHAALNPGVAFLEGPTHRRMVALTFDDGPSPYTPALLDVLKKYHVHATFFWIGKHVQEYDTVARRALAEGHTLGNHTFTHPDISGTAEDFWWDEQIGLTQDIFQRVIGKRPLLFRPPYGKIDDSEIKALNQHGLKTILWSIDTQDWNKNRWLFGTHHIERWIQQYIHEEAIILMHDGGGHRDQTVAAVDAVIPWLQKAGYQFVTVDQLLGIKQVYQ
ncbi:polysaccharide deacetylase family protein [Silvimonas amylolytica]|uniref:NodB homology domain-containing protein n=1 Tax=Silvimonas amylolytica TaxID=449663 RepID=A0ABQ2PLW1_9NEIS|nr:polysaccharide deacetylase family protein [Silvimonas amylolytica]GGP26592.1 hypothetical protein GCM10010971_24110 [Silvimonas amylolytica]